MIAAILRVSEVQKRAAHPRSTLYARIKQGLFPRPVKLGLRSSGWPENEVDAVIRSIISGSTEAEIRALVSQLQAARAAA